ncbi:serine hydroxymethyltransferase [Buchnera aphidicola]|uniref:serine hydroxymethyltransferase n=1 Tax=Buchnera aphidicola TaxID=9 RepID=UPI00094D170F|nr:serine hydroxymethyltransferase [Buchnera aphidicola]
MKNNSIYSNDDQIFTLIKKEKLRQEKSINLIASENYTSRSVMKAQGSCLTNKYAEGYIGNRFYDGCHIIDEIEKIAINRAKKLFKVDYVNVQPHSGSQANFSIFQALLKPNDIILGMNLMHGGHLTHGSSINFSGKIYRAYSYGVDLKGNLDYINLEYLSKKHRPQLIIGGFSAYSGICDWKRMRDIADSIGAYFIVDISHVAGLIVAGLYPNPFDYAHVVSTTTHKTLGGPRGGLILSRNGDKNMYKKLDSSVFPGSQGGPLMHVIAAKAISFKNALNSKFILLQKKILKYSKIMSETFINRKFAVVSGKTCNHLFLVDLSNKNLTGKEASELLSSVNIIVNKNTIPYDQKNPLITSGIRIGTPCVAYRGFKKNDIINISHWICDILADPYNHNIRKTIKKKVKKICLQYPIYEN